MGTATKAGAQPGSPSAAELLALPEGELLRLCEIDTYRASGPGGQKRNKTDSAVRLRLLSAGLSAIATESRSQHENKARALRRMRQAIALHVRSPLHPETYSPSETLKTFLHRGELNCGRRDASYPRVVSELLDLLWANGLRLSTTAAQLGITTGNLSAFVLRDAKLLERINQSRREAGMKLLH